MSPTTPSGTRTTDAAASGTGPTGRPSRKQAVLRALGVLGVIAVWLGIAGLGGPAIGSLSSVQSNDQASFLPAGAESVEAGDAAAAFSDDDSLPAFVVFAADGAATADQLAAWQAFAAGLAATPVTLPAGDRGSPSSRRRSGTTCSPPRCRWCPPPTVRPRWWWCR